MTSHHSPILNILLCLLVLASCEVLETPADVVHPLDPSNPDYEPPFVVFKLAPGEGETIDTSIVTFKWSGNETNMNYSYRIDDQEWSDWQLDSAKRFELLDDGEHTFEIKSRYFNNAESEEPQSISFIVDDLQPSSLTFFPRLVSYTGTVDASLEVFVHEVSKLAMVKAVIRFDPNLLEVSDVQVYESESFLAKYGGTVIPFASIDNSLGEVKIDVAVATGDSLSVSGTGALARLYLRMKTNIPAYLRFHMTSEYRTADNTTITITDFGHGAVHAE
ncbi:MAG: cohesin domain-containing protein [Candidatus Marinimicrobia bacterium]|nr:cohesin domain-containing protein [Candidatus Neomarinimicrobiota bacterium]